MYFRRKLFATTALIAAGLLSPSTASFAQNVGPTGGAVAAGGASITQNGRQTTVTQSTAKAIVEWRRFDVEAGSSVQFVQPSRESITLNRVREGDASRIDGSVNANGQIYVVNPNGVLIGPSGRINAAGFVASTHDVRNQDFMAGKMDFSVTSPNAAARVRNEGVIAASDGGYAVLAGGRVENAGVISARVGQVGLAGGDAVALDVVGDRLLQFQVTKPVSRDPGGAILSNTGTLSAPGGVVTLSAQAARNVIRDVINTTGVIEAQGATVEGGRVIIHGGESGTVQVGGSIDVSNANGVGGQVDVRGERVGLIDGAKIDASGAKGGGIVLVGGDWQGKGPGMTAQVAYVAPTASINVDATQNGDGGKAVVWADDTTRFNGSISARGGAHGGDGGQVETSGKRALAIGPTAAVTTAARAPKAKPGAWLLDPTDITISAGGGVTSITSPYAPGGTSSVTPGAITAALATGAVTIQTGDGTITVASPISYAGAASSLTLNAGLDIVLSSGIASTANALNVTLTATRAITVSADVTTLGGSFSATANTGGIAGSTNGYSQTAGTISTGAGAITINARAANSGLDGVAITGGTLTSTSGAISITGQRGGGTGARNILIGGAVISADSGAVTITGTSSAGGAGDGNHGVLIQNAATIAATGGNLSISGTAANIGPAAGEGQDGIFIRGANTTVQTVSGTITLTGASSFVGAQSLNEGVHVNTAASVLATGSGAITVNGTATASVDAGIFVETNGVIAANGSGAVNLNGFSTATGNGFVVWSTGRVGAASATGPLTITADQMAFDNGTAGTIQGAGALVIKPSTISTSIGVAGGAGNLNLTTLALSAFADGFSSRTFGRTDGTGAVTVNALSSPDALIINGGSVTIAGAVTTSGTDAITINANRTIAINDNLIASGAGAIVVTANAGGLGDGVGLSLASGKKITSAGGDILLTGTGGSSVAGDGIAINGGTVATTGGGAITFTGARGAATLNDTNRNIYTTNAQITTASGAITFSGASTTGDGVRGHGVFIDTGTTIATTSGGAIIMTGGRNAGDNSHNVVIRGPNTVVSTTGSGSISLTGTITSGGAGNFSFGVLVDQAGTVSTVGGAINFTGVGASSAFDGQIGVALRGGVGGALVQTQTGQITFTGDATANTALSNGVRIDASARVLGLNSGSAVSITGSSVGAPAIALETGGTVSVTGAGALTLTGDTLTVDSASSIQGQGALTIRPKTLTTSIGIAGGAGTLSLTTALLGQIAGTFASRTIGRSDGSGAITINAHASPDPLTIAGGAMSIAGALTTSGTDSLTLSAKGVVAVNADIATATGALTVYSDASTAAGGGNGLNVSSTGRIVSSGGNVTVTGIAPSAGADGVAVVGGTIATTGAGTVTVTGTRASGSVTGRNIQIQGAAARVTTDAGTLSLVGTATAGGNANSFGVQIEQGAIVSTNAGALSVFGNGSVATLSGQAGVALRSGAIIESSAGAISIVSVGGPNVPSGSGIVESEGLLMLGGSKIRGLANGSSVSINSTGKTGVAAGVYMDNSTIEVAGAGATTIDSVHDIFVTSNSFIGKVGATGPVTLTINGVSMYQPAGGGVAGTIAGAGALTIQPKTLSNAVNIGGAAGAGGLALSDLTLAQIQDGFSSRTFGRSDATGLTTVYSHASPDTLSILSGGSTGDITVAGSLSVSGADTLTLVAGRKVTLNSGASLASGATGTAITLANNGFSGSSFVNNAGGSVFSTPAGRWLVYSVDPATDTVGGLSAIAGTQFNKTYAAQPPATITGTVNYLIYSVAGVGAPPPAPPVVTTPVVTTPVVTPPVVTPPVVTPPVVTPPTVTPPIVTPPVVTVSGPTAAEIAAAEEARRQALIDAAEKTAAARTFQAQTELASVIKTLPPGSATTYLSTDLAQDAIRSAAGLGVSALSPDLVVAVVNVLGNEITKMMPPPPAPVVVNDPIKTFDLPKPTVNLPALSGPVGDVRSFAQVGPSFNAASLLSSIGDLGGSIGSFGALSSGLSSSSFAAASSFSAAPPGIQGMAGGMTGAVFSAPSTVSVVPDDGVEGGGAPQRERTGLGAPSTQEEGETVMPGVLKSFGGQGGRGGNRSPYNTPFFVPLQNEVLRD